MNPFVVSVHKLINRHGTDHEYSRVTTTRDNATRDVITTKITAMLKMWPKQIKATQYNYPNLIGKDVIQFHVGIHDDFNPKTGDFVNGYRITEVVTTVARGEVVFYRLLGVKG